MVTLTYLLKKPVAGDRGNALFAALEGNINQLDAHTHDGVTSPKLPGKSIVGAVVFAVSGTAPGAWENLVDGVYSQNVNLPSGYSYDEQKITVKLTSTKEYVYAKIEKFSSGVLKIYSNDSTVGFDILVGG